MSALVCFAVFLAGVAVCLHMGWALIWAMLLGIAAFGALGLRHGFSLRTLWGFAWGQGRKMCSLLVIYVLIGMITALWRSAGTIAWFIYHGLQIITPQLFILVTFALTCFLSYALGTSFGVVGTAGIILMALARSGGVSTAVAAGAIVAGAYFGDRCSPASSSASLVAAATLSRTRLLTESPWSRIPSTCLTTSSSAAPSRAVQPRTTAASAGVSWS